MSVQLSWMFHRQILADLIFIVVDHDEVAGQAAAHHGSDDPSIYGNALKHVANNRVIIQLSLLSHLLNQILYFQQEHRNPIDEQEANEAHDKAYNQGGGSNLSAQAMGGAAAMQVS